MYGEFEVHISSFLEVASKGRSDDICLFRRKEVNLVLLSYSKRYLDMHISNPIKDLQWRMTTVYGHPELSHQKKIWDLLCSLKRTEDSLKLCFWDFNEIIANFEKLGGRDRSLRQMLEFRYALDFIFFSFSWY